MKRCLHLLGLAGLVLAIGVAGGTAQMARRRLQIRQAVANPYHRQVVRALLDRSRYLEDVRVEVPVELWREYLARMQGLPQRAAPVKALWDNASYELQVAADGARVLRAEIALEVFQPIEEPLAVFTREVVWDRLTLNGEDVRLVPKGEWLLWQPPAPGRYIFEATCRLPGGGAAGGQLQLPIAPTTRTLLRFDSPEAWHVTVPDWQQVDAEQVFLATGASNYFEIMLVSDPLREIETAVVSGSMSPPEPEEKTTDADSNASKDLSGIGEIEDSLEYLSTVYTHTGSEEGTHLELPLSPRRILELHFEPPRVHFEKPTRYSLLGMMAWNVDSVRAHSNPSTRSVP